MTGLTFAYGADSSQFGVLYGGSDDGPPARPVVVLVHGGFWRAAYGLDLMEPLAEDLVGRGYAVWNIEYRRVGQPGGGWPGTLEDAAAAVDALADIASAHPIDATRVAVVGHSAGGHLALWIAGRTARCVRVELAIGLGAVVDLEAADRAGLGRGAVAELLGGSTARHPERCAIATPTTGGGAQLVVVRGSLDDVVPPLFSLPPDGGDVEVIDIDGDDHMALIDPRSRSWSAVVERLRRWSEH